MVALAATLMLFQRKHTELAYLRDIDAQAVKPHSTEHAAIDVPQLFPSVFTGLIFVSSFVPSLPSTDHSHSTVPPRIVPVRYCAASRYPHRIWLLKGIDDSIASPCVAK